MNFIIKRGMYPITPGYEAIYAYKHRNDTNNLCNINSACYSRKILEISLYSDHPEYLLRDQRKLTLLKPFSLEITRKIMKLINNRYVLLYIRRVIKYIPYLWLRNVNVSKIIKSFYTKLIRYIPEDLLTDNVLKSFIRNAGLNVFNRIPRHMKTIRMATIFISMNGRDISWIPRKLITMEIFIEAIRSSCWALNHIPNRMKTYEVIEIALNQWSRSALQFIPEHLRTDEINKLIEEKCNR